jgi:hypothetical protein
MAHDVWVIKAPENVHFYEGWLYTASIFKVGKIRRRLTSKNQGLISFDVLLRYHFEGDVNWLRHRTARRWRPGCMNHLAEGAFAEETV